MKTYIDAELQIVRVNNRDIITNSINVTTTEYNGDVYAPDRMRD